MIILTYFYI